MNDFYLGLILGMIVGGFAVWLVFVIRLMKARRMIDDLIRMLKQGD